MRKKRKKKKRSIATDGKAIYQRAMQLYLEEENYVAGLKYQVSSLRSQLE